MGGAKAALPLVAVAAVMLLGLLLLPVLLPLGLMVGLLMWVQDEAPQVPPRLEAYYRQVQSRTGVPWSALAAWDGAENEFDLPVESTGTIFDRLYREALRRKRRRWREWCDAHRDPITGEPPSPYCDPPPPDLTDHEVQRIWQETLREHRRQILRHIESHAAYLAARIEWFARNPEEAYRGGIADRLVPLANDLFEGYTLQADLDALDPLDPAYPGPAPELPPGFTPPGGFDWPAEGPITSRYGLRISPIDGQPRLHAGIDLGIPAGSPIVASKTGWVTRAGFDTVYGHVVVIDHGGGYTTLYAHNTRLEVREGQRVQQGEVIALSGSSGWSTGPHLHFEIRLEGTPYDPLLFLGRP